MKFAVILFLFGCIVANVHSKPLTDDSSEKLQKLFGASKVDEMEKYMQCGVTSYKSKDKELKDLLQYVMSLNDTLPAIISRVGTDEFNVNEYKETCTELTSEVYKFLITLRNEVKTCADNDMMKFVDFFLDFSRANYEFQCNWSEKELLYMKSEIVMDWIKCISDALPKVQKCLVVKETNSIDIEKNSIQNILCKIDFVASGECLKTVSLECGEEQAHLPNLIIDFMLKYLGKHLECPVEDLSENTI